MVITDSGDIPPRFIHQRGAIRIGTVDGQKQKIPMSHKKKVKTKDDLSKNPDQVDTSKGREYLKQGKVKILSHATRNIQHKDDPEEPG
ncbi:MAG: hypothetical protein WCT23_10580 [Candidatus Neomarinimicrobiota bacterium]